MGYFLALDSATAANAATIASVNPSTALIVLVLGGGMIYLLSLLLKNTAITKLVAEKLASSDETAQTIRDIRAGQIESNKERRELGIRIAAVEGRMDRLERICGQHGTYLERSPVER